MAGPIDLEWLALVAGVKPALRIALDPARRVAVVERAERIGATALEARRLASIGARELSVLYVSRDPQHGEALRDAEEPVLPGGPSVPPGPTVLDAHRRTGALLGYPSCCVEAFVARVARGVTRRERGGEASEEFVAIEAAALRSARHDARVNVLRRRDAGALIAFHPCTLDCDRAIGIAGAVHGALRVRDRDGAARIESALKERISISSDGALHAGEPPAGALSLRFEWPAAASAS